MEKVLGILLDYPLSHLKSWLSVHGSHVRRVCDGNPCACVLKRWVRAAWKQRLWRKGGDKPRSGPRKRICRDSGDLIVRPRVLCLPLLPTLAVF